MAPLLNPPFRADHIGSLKRPAALLQKRAEFDAQKISQEELTKTEDEAINDIVKMQNEVGIKAVTDGEFRRHMFFDGVFDNMDGMKFVPDVPLEWFMDYVPDTAGFKAQSFKKAASYLCEGKLHRTKSFYRSQFEYMKKITPPENHKNIKITMCAPEWFHLRHGPHAYPKEVYANDDEYFADIAVAYQEEIAELYSLGCRNIQFDDPLLAYFCAESMITGMEKEGIDHEKILTTYIKAYQDCLKGKPEDMNAGLHLCRGNFRDGRHFAEGGYDRIAVRLFNEIPVECYYLEYDTSRAGTFEPLRFMPKDKVVVLGLLTSKFPQLEDKEELKAKVHAAASVIANGTVPRSQEEALNQICISPQCGFASHADGNPVTEADVIKKLSLVVETAKEIWADA
ncbi:UROD/MetE-like protein [Stereum hirsutum FP-91666 SS1]|uniref:UROD/MetE-like protein n=1 Tax=Stereum hirsutum (strain FP-91666) TaxID=721885 RepID=UPI000444A753|nr:UROD/MetE-like protein [Stereum hirsutum FP-91666 SS1]EIM83799.1 UROD/MetE-like protein [Stereum hirsutum FP-91666 SS1]